MSAKADASWGLSLSVCLSAYIVQSWHCSVLPCVGPARPCLSLSPLWARSSEVPAPLAQPHACRPGSHNRRCVPRQPVGPVSLGPRTPPRPPVYQLHALLNVPSERPQSGPCSTPVIEGIYRCPESSACVEPAPPAALRKGASEVFAQRRRLGSSTAPAASGQAPTGQAEPGVHSSFQPAVSGPSCCVPHFPFRVSLGVSNTNCRTWDWALGTAWPWVKPGSAITV